MNTECMDAPIFNELSSLYKYVSRLVSSCIIALCLLSYSGFSISAPLAGSSIINTAEVQFQMNGTQHTPITAQNTITVDAKLSLNVDSKLSEALPVIANQAQAALPFIVTNLSNSTNDILLDAKLSSADANNKANTYTGFTDTDHQVFVDVNNDGEFDPAVDTATFIDDLPPNGTQTVFIVTNIPASITEDELAAVALVAQIADTNGNPITSDQSGNTSPAGNFENGVTSAAGAAASVNKNANPLATLSVFADGAGDIASDGSNDIANNGQFSDANGYLFAGSPADITKSAQVIDCQSKEPIITPLNEVYSGLCIAYTIVVVASQDNTTNVVVNDTIPAGTQYMTNSITLNNTEKTDTSDTDEASSDNTAISVNLGTMNKDDSHSITFVVSVN